MKKVPFSFDWKRVNGRVRWFGGPQAMESVDLPDDFVQNKHRTPDAVGGSSTGFIPGGEATYCKDFQLPEEWADKTVLLDIDGAYMNAEIKLNNDLLFHHPYGYTAIQLDLTDKLRKEGVNHLQIATECFQPNTRWYSGGGVYREVCVWLGGRAHIRPWELFLTTPVAEADKAVVHVEANVTNTCKATKANVALRVLAACGKVVAETSIDMDLAEKADTAFTADMTIIDPKRWDLEAPYLYTLQATVLPEGGEADVYETKFGVRKIEIDFENGFRLNGKPLKLRGGCIHHDNTLLGSRAFPRAEERKIEILQSAGYNAIRCAHNPPSTAMLDICDRLGMLVLDESFDMWTMGKNTLDYHLYFDKWWQFDTESMVKRDRNHPSVYCWSIGNEIPEITGKSDGANWAKKQADLVRSLDNTRPVTSALHGGTDTPPELEGKIPPRVMDRKRMLTGGAHMPSTINGRDLWGEQTKAAIDALDIVGYNYLFRRYTDDRVKFPDRVIHATETHAFNTYDYWQGVLDNSNVIGDFIWTAYDNLGEAGAGRVIWDLNEPLNGLMGQYPWLSCYQGDHDLDGNRRPQGWYRSIMWGKDKGIHLFTTPPEKTGQPYYGMGWHWADVKPDWTFADEWIGKPVQLEAYADCDEIEFFVNGESRGKSAVEKLKAFLTTEYTPGLVEAVALKDGKEIARDSIRTAGKAAQIVLKADRPVFSADGMDICFVTAELQDANGVRIVSSPVELSATVSGAGTLAGFGSGNPKTDEDYGTGRRFTFDGRALIAIRAGREAGDVQLAVTSANLPAALLTVKAE